MGIIEVKTILTIIVILTYILCNIYWHKRITDGKWIYTIYTTIMVATWTLFAWINLS